MKYITTTQVNGVEEIFTFSNNIHHDCMAEVICRIRNQSHDDWERVNRTPISAGFVEGGKCVGESESLKLKSRPEDTILLNENH